MNRLGLLLLLALGFVVLAAAAWWGVRATESGTAAPAAGPAAAAPDELAPSLVDPGDDTAPEHETPRSSSKGERVEVPLGAASPSTEADTIEHATIRLLLRSRDTGAPVVGTAVRAWSRRARSGATEVTGDDGRAELVVPAGHPSTVSVSAVLEAHGAASSSVPPLAANEAFDLVLEVSTDVESVFRGRVIAQESGEPIPGASVEVRETTHWRADSAGDYSGQTLSTVAADEEGNFTVAFRPWSMRLHVLVESPGRVLRVRELHSSAPDAAPDEIKLALAAVLTVTVTTADGGPLSGTEVRAVTTDRMRFGDVSVGDHVWTGTTDVAGRVRLAELPPDVALELDVLLPGEQRRRKKDRVRLEPGQERELTLAMWAGAVVRGRVERVGQARSSYTSVSIVRAGSNRAGLGRDNTIWSDSQGRFEFEDVPDGDWIVQADLSMYASLEEQVRVRGGFADREVVLRAHRGLQVSGSVVGPDGEPVRDARVSVASLEGGSGASAMTTGAGEFEAGPLVPGRVELTARSKRFADSERVVAEAGAEGVVLRLEHGGSIRGRVVMPGDQLVRAYVTALGGPTRRAMSTELGGSFDLQGLAPGTYELSARVHDSAGFAFSGPIQVFVGSAAEVELTAEPGATLRLRNESEARVVYAVRRGSTPVAGGSIRSGEADLVAIPAGEVTVDFGASDLRAVRASPDQKVEMSYGGGQR